MPLSCKAFSANANNCISFIRIVAAVVVDMCELWRNQDDNDGDGCCCFCCCCWCGYSIITRIEIFTKSIKLSFLVLEQITFLEMRKKKWNKSNQTYAHSRSPTNTHAHRLTDTHTHTYYRENREIHEWMIKKNFLCGNKKQLTRIR